MTNSNEGLKRIISKVLKEQASKITTGDSISKCFNENNCSSKVQSKLSKIIDDLSLPDTKRTKERLLNSCSKGPTNSVEEIFCRMALTLCGIDVNNCIESNMR